MTKYGRKQSTSLGGLEPPTFRLTAERANRLRHRDLGCWQTFTNANHQYRYNDRKCLTVFKPFIGGTFSKYPIWSSGQDSCLSRRRPGFDSRCGNLIFQKNLNYNYLYLLHFNVSTQHHHSNVRMKNMVLLEICGKKNTQRLQYLCTRRSPPMVASSQVFSSFLPSFQPHLKAVLLQ